MRIAFTPDGWEDYLYWQGQDRKTLVRINELIRDMRRHPFEGIGKPEPLKGTLKGMWSRRITQEHRIAYAVVGTGEDQTLVILQCRYHY
ncbi:Txe/YoeB family addiction module toxin [Rhizobium rosettiformans]|uniref:Txe/YoeB family addiction module toxin n=1 Tax=Rhizobium rosettiformans TaxID=1368430 RepID=UPI00285B652D|nr:Txe/YoeB family addiction module toxin [Rhizobium rosettiformans]MDR7029588.1 toxin YoeB [Rhizobium rosettiformans]MDR7063302.1 toxin YoeB [Rhizobium rosettiformans]